VFIRTSNQRKPGFSRQTEHKAAKLIRLNLAGSAEQTAEHVFVCVCVKHVTVFQCSDTNLGPGISGGLCFSCHGSLQRGGQFDVFKLDPFHFDTPVLGCSIQHSLSGKK